MKTAKSLFTHEEIEAVEATIGEVEKQTSAEVVPVVATSSGRYDRAEDIFGFLLAIIVLAVTWICFQGLSESADAWTAGPSIVLTLPFIICILIVVFIVGTVLASFCPILRLPFIPKKEMQEEVENRAQRTFQQLKIRQTKNATGLLIYISLYEHRVHVVGDDTISAKLSQTDWQDICDTIIAGFKADTPAKGLKEGLLQSRKILSAHFPIDPDDRNEISNTLHLID